MTAISSLDRFDPAPTADPSPPSPPPAATPEGGEPPPSASSWEASPDCRLFRRCLEGRGSEEWRQFQGRYESTLRNLLWRRARGVVEGQLELEVEDLLQELYCRLLSAGRSGRFLGRSDAELSRYLTRAAISVVADRRRALRADKRRIPVPNPRDETTHRPLEERMPACSEEETPERRYLLREARRTFLRHCDRLVGTQRGAKLGALRLALLDGCDSREVARRLGGALTPAQVDRLVHDLRRRLSREGIELPRRRRGGCRPRGGARRPVRSPRRCMVKSHG